MPEKEECFATDRYGYKLAKVIVNKPHKKNLCSTCAATLNDFINNLLPIASNKDGDFMIKMIIESKHVEND